MGPYHILYLNRGFGAISFDEKACYCYELSLVNQSQVPDMQPGRNHTNKCTAWMEKAGINFEEFETVYLAREDRIQEKLKAMHEDKRNDPLSLEWFRESHEDMIRRKHGDVESILTNEKWDRYEGDGSLADMFRSFFTSVRRALSPA